MKKAMIILYVVVFAGIAGILGYKLGCFDNVIKKLTTPKLVQLVDADVVPDDINLQFMTDNYFDYVKDTNKQFKDNEKLYEEIIDIINKYRFDAGKPGLVIDNELMQLAQIRAEEIATTNKMSHTRPDGKYFSALFQEYGWNAGQAGENIAWGYKTAEEVCQQWKLSQDHYENLINGKWTRTGIGIATYKDGTLAFVQEFATDVTGPATTETQ